MSKKTLRLRKRRGNKKYNKTKYSKRYLRRVGGVEKKESQEMRERAIRLRHADNVRDYRTNLVGSSDEPVSGSNFLMRRISPSTSPMTSRITSPNPNQRGQRRSAVL